MNFASIILVASIIIATTPKDFTFIWAPSPGSVVGYEVEINAGIFRKAGSYSVVRILVTENSITFNPLIGAHYMAIKVRGLRGQPVFEIDAECPFTFCSFWSEIADEEIVRINNPDSNGDGIIDASDFIIWSNLWGSEVENDLIILGE